jgi:hypothetical protein
VDDSFDELGFLETRHRIVPPLELLAAQPVALFQTWDRVGLVERLGGSGRLGPGD